MRQPRNAQQIADNPYNLPEPIIEDILNEGELAILSAPYGSFKSYFSLEMAYSILTGEPFLNRFEVKNLGPVYFFELEIHRGVFDGRINNLKMTREQRENFWVDYDQFRFDGRYPGTLEQIIGIQKPKLIIFDPLASFWISGMRENDSAMVATALRPLLELRTTGTSFLIVHGDTKSEGEGGPVRARGSSELLYRPDQRLFLDRLGSSGDMIDSARVTMRPRNGKSLRAFYVTLTEEKRLLYDDDETLPKIYMQKVQTSNNSVSTEAPRIRLQR